MKTHLALAALSLVIATLTATPSPSPSPWPTPQATDTAVSPKREQPGNQGQATTEDVPAIQKHQDTGHTTEEGAENDQGSEMLELNRGLTKYTGQLANYTWALVIIGALQIIVGAFQVALFWRSFTISSAAYKLSERIFALTHRPLVYVRNATLPLAPTLDGKIDVRLTIVNRGSTPATILRTRCGIAFDYDAERFSGIGSSFFYDEGIDQLPHVLEPGVAHPIRKDTVPVGDGMQDMLWSAAVSDFRVGTSYVHVMGSITYSDTDGVVHETGFCRRYDPNHWVLTRIDDPDYEYQE